MIEPARAMLTLTITRTLRLPISPEAAYDWITDPAHMDLFTGAGPIPGIATVAGAGMPRRAGQVDRVTNTDGSEHDETVLVADRPARYELRIEDFPLPPALLVDHMVETWAFSSDPAGVAISRRFAIALRNNPVAWLLGPVVQTFMAQAVDRHHQALAATCGVASA